MIKHFNRTWVSAAIALALALPSGMALARKAPETKPKPVEVAAPVGAPVAYDELEQHVGDELVIETTLSTVRRGKLLKYTNPALVVQLGPEHGSIELTVPRDTVRSIRVVPAAAGSTDSAHKSGQGSGSAEKN